MPVEDLILLDQAMEDLDKAIQDQPRSGSTYSLRALAWVELGDVEKALTDAKKAIELEPESAGCHCVYALILAGGIQDHGGAMVEFDQARSQESAELLWPRALLAEPERNRQGHRGFQ